ncbi:hypothetical protein WOLCODRAFT_138616 [Wolfiporia cocos MD-104 SS10]|uniref:RhoGAP-domain-containing protein n=1 Tax=Wolfiporia cocos (strain MD-104) TaxID=742152 RepID=A0A2H3JNR9_WOLCO|nr:hypothetical protein WOLCODRAFT_138616 [Wolfiporia cocos MD-104 SS10]
MSDSIGTGTPKTEPPAQLAAPDASPRSSAIKDTTQTINSIVASPTSPFSEAVVSSNGSSPTSMGGSTTNHAPSPNNEWGSKFWVTLVDPQTQVSFYGCPATGEVSWDPPIGNFLLPPNPEGEWWEMIDETSGLPYYYHTKSGETTWERPQAFVIPLGILQNTALGRRLSLRRTSQIHAASSTPATSERPSYRRSHSFVSGKSSAQHSGTEAARQRRRSHSSAVNSPSKTSSGNASPNSRKQTMHRPATSGEHKQSASNSSAGPLAYPCGHPLAPIPGSPYVSDRSSNPPTPTRKSMSATSMHELFVKAGETDGGKDVTKAKHTGRESRSSMSRSKSSGYLSYRAPQPQSLSAALEMIALSDSQSSSSASDKRASSETRHSARTPSIEHEDSRKLRINTSAVVNTATTAPATPQQNRGKKDKTSPVQSRRPTAMLSVLGSGKFTSEPSPVLVSGKMISSPVYNAEATINLGPMIDTAASTPIPVDPFRKAAHPKALINTGKHPVLPQDLSSDIQQFAESQFARKYFSTHRTGFLFKRRIPVAQMMTWQKSHLCSPLLMLHKSLHKDAIKIFKVIQHIMGDRDKDRPVAVRLTSDHGSVNGSTTSLVNGPSAAMLEEERWLLGEGITHGELRDEIYCQVLKQLTGNPNTESIFKGWQLLCVLLVTFPPSKDFETYLQSYLQQAKSHNEARIDVMAKYCIRRLANISRKGPRGKPPSTAEIETASDAAFHPSIFGESLDTVFRLQERNYPHMKVPIVLPFLADGILALGGTKTEGIFRVPGDGDAVSELKLKIDKGYYSLDSVDDPHILASLLKLWLRELCDPLVPDEMYNDCITSSRSPEACVQMVHRLPTINRRVVLFIISFLQLFLDDKIQTITKMTSPNLALVMAPNLLRCDSDSMAVVFTNAQYEQTFVHNLLLHLQCDLVDPDYIPTHGQGAASPSAASRTSQSRRRPIH